MLKQSDGNAVYQFALTGRELLDVADISRISRDEAGKLIGYQRPEVKKHVKDNLQWIILKIRKLIEILSFNKAQQIL